MIECFVNQKYNNSLTHWSCRWQWNHLKQCKKGKKSNTMNTIETEDKWREKYRMRGLNSRPLACEASVITTTPTRPVTFPQRTVFHNKERMIILPTSPPSTRYTTCSCRGAIWTHCPWCVHWSGPWAFSCTDTYWGGSTHTQFDAWSLQWSHPPDRCVAIPGSSHTRPCTIQIHSKSPTFSFFF